MKDIPIVYACVNVFDDLVKEMDNEFDRYVQDTTKEELEWLRTHPHLNTMENFHVFEKWIDFIVEYPDVEWLNSGVNYADEANKSYLSQKSFFEGWDACLKYLEENKENK